MLKTFWEWVIYGDCSQEPSDNIEFLKGLHPMTETVGRVKNENMD